MWQELQNRIRPLPKIVEVFFPHQKWLFFCLLFFVIELTIGFFAQTGVWENPSLSFSTKMAMCTLALLAWVILSWAVAGYFAAVRYLYHGILSQRISRLALRIFSAILISTLLFTYFASWRFHSRMGIFPGESSFRFLFVNYDLLLKYFLQKEFIPVVLTLAVSLLLLIATYYFSSSILQSALPGPQKNASFHYLFGFFLVLNGVFITIISYQYCNDPLLIIGNRIDAFNRPHPTLAYEMKHRLTPLVSYLITFSEQTNHLPGSIPDDLLKRLDEGVVTADPEKPRRSVILIVIESLRQDVIFKKHQGQYVVPNIRKLALNGMFFNNLLANSTHSDYSDPAIISSLYPLRKEYPYYYKSNEPWPKMLGYDLLSSQGFSTAMFSSQNEAWSNMHLFYESPHLDVFFDSRSQCESKVKFMEDSHFGKWTREIGLGGKLDDAVTRMHAINWLKTQNVASHHYFLLMNFQTSHFPYIRPDGEKGPFTPAQVNQADNFEAYPAAHVESIRNSYFNALRYVDDQVGHLVEYLDQTGQRKNTVIAITGDHGEAFNETGFISHAGYPVDTVLNTGLILNCPGLLPPKIEPYLSQAIDILPTIVELAGIPTHPNFQGINLLDPNRPPSAERFINIHCCNPLTNIDAVISGTGWKYVKNYRTQKNGLFYYSTNEFNQIDLTDRYAEVAKILDENLTNWRRNQLLYYSQSKYYTCFYPPRLQSIKPRDLKVLLDAI